MKSHLPQKEQKLELRSKAKKQPELAGPKSSQKQRESKSFENDVGAGNYNNSLFGDQHRISFSRRTWKSANFQKRKVFHGYEKIVFSVPNHLKKKLWGLVCTKNLQTIKLICTALLLNKNNQRTLGTTEYNPG